MALLAVPAACSTGECSGVVVACAADRGMTANQRIGNMRTNRRAIGLGVLLFAGAACGQPATSGSATVQVVGAWEGTETDTFLSVVAPFEAATGIDVIYLSTRDLRGVIDDGLTSGDPPDLSGLEGPAHMAELVARGALRDLGTAIDVQAYRAVVAPTFTDLGSVDGRLYGVFVKATVKGLIWYHPDAFRRGTPTAWDDLQVLAQRSLAGEMRQWCVGLESGAASGWPGTDWIESLVLHRNGEDVYDAWVDGTLPWTSPEIRRAFQTYGQVVAEDAVYGGSDGALGTYFADAGAPLFLEPPGCLLLHQGSFMPAFFESAGMAAGNDFDFFPFPPMSEDDHGAVIGAGDLIGLFTDDPSAAQLIDYLVSDEAQQLWVEAGGALSVNRRVTDYPNEVVEREAELLSGADHFRFDASDHMPPDMNAAFWRAILDFTADQSRLDEILDQLETVRATAYD
jgi:alpha-glucoside transport system substrate-binding protein